MATGIRLIFLDVDGVLCCNKHGHLEADKLKRLGESAAKRANGARRSRQIPQIVDTFFGTLVTMRCVSHCVCVCMHVLGEF